MSYNSRPLYSEYFVKASQTINIKVSSNKWIPKSRWVWLETHPEAISDYDPARDVFIFLDGDKSNYNPSNIEKVTRGEEVYINTHCGGIPKGSDPEKIKFYLAQARLKKNILDLAEKAGLTRGRIIKTKAREYCRRHRAKLTPEQKDQLREANRAWRASLPPERKEKMKESQRRRSRKYYYKHKEKEKAKK